MGMDRGYNNKWTKAFDKGAPIQHSEGIGLKARLSQSLEGGEWTKSGIYIRKNGKW
jgi:hypothetical protein